MRSMSEILARHEELTPEHLIPLLQEVQEEHGFVSRQAMEELAAGLGIPVSRVYGAATFYNQFRFAPTGEHVVEVCRGTACHVKGSSSLADAVTRRLKIGPDGNSRDGRFTLITVACMGACSIAPVVKVDGEFYGHLTAEKLDHLLDELEQPQAAAASGAAPAAERKSNGQSNGKTVAVAQAAR